MRTTHSGRRWKLGLILTAVLLIRLAFFVAGAPWDTEKAEKVYLKADPGGYHRLALNLMRTGQYVFRADPDPKELSEALSDPKLWRLPQEPEALWPPLYSLFLAGIYSLFGIQIAPAILIQIILSPIVAWLLYLTTMRLFNNEKAALLSAFLFAIEPTMILISNILYSDFIFIFFFSFFYFLLICQFQSILSHLSHKALWWGLAAGLSLGLATMTHARGVIFLPISLLVPLLVFRGVPLPLRLFSVFAVLLGYSLGTGYWYWRNYRVFGEWAFSTSSSYNLLVSTAPLAPVSGREASIEWVFKQARLRMEQKGDPLQMNPFERARIWREAAVAIIRERPLEYFRTHLKRIFVVAFVPGTSEYEAILSRSGWSEQFKIKESRLPRMSALRWLIFTWVILFTLFLYLVGGISLLRCRERLSKFAALFAAVACTIVLLASLSATHPRMRAPILLLLLPYSGAGWTAIGSRISSLSRRQAEQHFL